MKDFFKNRKVLILLVLIILIGASLRLYKFHNFVRFNSDQVRDSKIVDKMIEEKDFPLLGPPAASTQFKLGPAYYYMEYLSSLIFGNNPSGVAFFVVILSIFSIPLLFVFLRYYFFEDLSLFLTFLYAVSFYAIKYSRFTWNPNVIPFFLLIFLILLLKLSLKKELDKKFLRLFLLIGIVIGISIQLHTILMALMPLMFFSVCIYLYFKTKNIKSTVSGFILAVFAAFLLNIPVFVYDLKNDGKNFKAFFSVAQNRTGENVSVSEKFSKTGQFFVQSSIYVLSGYEPTKNWTEIKKFLNKKNSSEIMSAITGTLFLLLGLLTLISCFLKEKREKRKIFLGISLGIIIFSTPIFMLVTEMLKSRFFIVIFFIPFLLLGIILNKLTEFIGKKTTYIFIIGLIVLLSFLNFRVFSGIYSDRDYQRKNSLYGGISLKETEDISRFIVDYSKKEASHKEKIYLSEFEFFQSVNYFNKKSKLNTALFSEGELGKNDLLFVVGKSKNENRIIEKNNVAYLLVTSKDLGKFTVFVFEGK